MYRLATTNPTASQTDGGTDRQTDIRQYDIIMPYCLQYNRLKLFRVVIHFVILSTNNK